MGLASSTSSLKSSRRFRFNSNQVLSNSTSTARLTPGNILINDIPIKLIPNQTLREHVSVLFADEELFSGTLLENLTIGNKNIQIEEIDKVCKIVGLYHFIQELKMGYQTLIDSQGKKMSYNVIQKILLARSLLQKPALLMLEDNWMSIEPLVRTQIINYLTDQINPSTLIAITNDETFIKKCNRIISIIKGLNFSEA